MDVPAPEIDDTEVAFQRLREVLAAPDRRSWRRHLRRTRVDPGESPGDLAGNQRRQWGWGAVVAVPLLGAAVILITSVMRPPDAGAGRTWSAEGTQASVPEGPAPLDPSQPTGTSSPGSGERVWPGEPISVDGTVVIIGDRRWSVGAAGDMVLVGDWDCDGAPTPAVLRPGDGGFFVFDRWAGEGEAATARKIGQFPGAVSATAAGCGTAVVTLAGGGQRRLETASSGR